MTGLGVEEGKRSKGERCWLYRDNSERGDNEMIIRTMLGNNEVKKIK